MNLRLWVRVSASISGEVSRGVPSPAGRIDARRDMPVQGLGSWYVFQEFWAIHSVRVTLEDEREEQMARKKGPV